MSILLSSLAPASFQAPVAPAHARMQARSQVSMETVKDLEGLAVKLNPVVGYWNPTSLADMEFWGQTQDATIGFLRQAEIK